MAARFFAWQERWAPAWIIAPAYGLWTICTRRVLVPGTRRAALQPYRPPETPPTIGKIGVIIPTKNHPERLRRCVESVFRRAGYDKEPFQNPLVGQSGERPEGFKAPEEAILG